MPGYSRREHRARARTGALWPMPREPAPAASPRGWTTAACCASSSSCCGTAACWQTRLHRGPTTAGTTPSTPASPRSSSSRSACCAACRWATPALHCPAVMVNLLGDLWANGAAALGARAATPSRQAAPVRQARGAARPQDGPLHRARRQRRGRAGCRAGDPGTPARGSLLLSEAQAVASSRAREYCRQAARARGDSTR